MKKNYLIACLIVLLSSTGGFAQSPSDKPDTGGSIGFWYGYSPSSNSFFAKMKQTTFFLVGLDVRYPTLSLDGFSINLSSQIIAYSKTHFPSNGISGPKETRNGYGITPLRISVPITANKSYPYISAGAGLLLFNKRFPTEEGTRLNATLDLGTGYNIYLNNKYRLDLGYRFHHLSNGDTGEVNPGIDSNLFVATLQIIF